MIYQKEIDTILLEATNSSEALRDIYQFRKSRNKSLSLARLCQITGIKSKGYLSEVFAGKKVIAGERLKALLTSLDIEGVHYDYIRTLAARDQLLNQEDLPAIEKRLKALRISLKVLADNEKEELPIDLFELEIYCAFGLFGGTASRTQLIKYFGRDRGFALDRCLTNLVRRNWITKEDDTTQAWGINRKHVLLSENNNQHHLSFLQQSIIDAANSIEKWYADKRVAHFESFILSVRSEDYEKAMRAFREKLLVLCNDLESIDADRLVKINLQAYPLR